jgi:hypothetical protein
MPEPELGDNPLPWLPVEGDRPDAESPPGEYAGLVGDKPPPAPPGEYAGEVGDMPPPAPPGE